MALRPLKRYRDLDYPTLGRRALQGLFVAAAMSATTLGGCGPTIDSRSLDSALDSGDLDAAACDGNKEDCGDGQHKP